MIHGVLIKIWRVLLLIRLFENSYVGLVRPEGPGCDLLNPTYELNNPQPPVKHPPLLIKSL